MSGTSKGGKKAAKTNQKLHGKDFYAKIGAKGGSAEHKGPRGFAADPKRAKEAGRVGGLISRRTGVKNGEGNTKPRKKKTTTKKTAKAEEAPKKGLMSRLFRGKNG